MIFPWKISGKVFYKVIRFSLNFHTIPRVFQEPEFRLFYVIKIKSSEITSEVTYKKERDLDEVSVCICWVAKLSELHYVVIFGTERFADKQ